MKDAFSLKILDIFKLFFILLGVDYKKMRAILSIKLLDLSRDVPLGINVNSINKKRHNFQALAYFNYIFIGIAISFMPFLVKNIFASMLMLFSTLFVFMAMSFISDYSKVFLDTKDTTLLFPKPVDLKTIFVSKLVYIFLFILKVALSMSFISFITISIKYGAKGVFLFGFLLLFLVINTVIYTAFIYLFLSRIFKKEVFRDMINYFQVFLLTITLIGTQIMFRLFDISKQISGMTVEFKWWYYLFPPAWYSAFFKIVFNNTYEIEYVFLSIFGLIFTLFSVFIIPIFFTDIYSNKIMRLKGSKLNKTGKSIFLSFLSSLFCKERIEKAFFEFTWLNLGRDRNFKLKVYPHYLYGPAIIMIPFIFSGDVLKNLIELPGSNLFIPILYSFAMCISIPFMWYSKSEEFRSSWIYLTLPLKDFRASLKGIYKAIAIKYVFIEYSILAIFVFLLFQKNTLPDILLATMYIFFYTQSYLIIKPKKLLFSEKMEIIKSKNNLITILTLMAITFGFAFFHWNIVNDLTMKLTASLTLFSIDILMYMYLLENLIIKKNKPAEKKKVIEKKAKIVVKKPEFNGKLWKCACGELNLGVAENCRTCGASKMQATKVITEIKHMGNQEKTDILEKAEKTDIPMKYFGFKDLLKILGTYFALHMILIFITDFFILHFSPKAELIKLYGKASFRNILEDSKSFFPSYSLQGILVSIFFSLFMIFLYWDYGCRKYAVSIKEFFAIRKISFKRVMRLFIYGGLYSSACSILIQYVIVIKKSEMSYILTDSNNAVYFMIYAIIFAPFIEELFFRCVLYNILIKKFSFSITCFFVAFFFMLAHVSQYYPNYFQISYIFLMGIMITYFRKKDDSIFSSMTLHYGVNFFAYATTILLKFASF